jgi:hypothetical protein
MNRVVDTQTIDLLTPETLAQVENHVQCRLGGQVHDFRLVVRNGGLILVGQAHVYHARLFAEQAVSDAVQLPIMANEIEVS